MTWGTHVGHAGPVAVHFDFEERSKKCTAWPDSHPQSPWHDVLNLILTYNPLHHLVHSVLVI